MTTDPLDVPAAGVETPPGFDTWTAADKRAWFDDLFETTAYLPVERPDLRLPAPWVMLGVAGRPWVLERTLDRTDDLMEPERPKIIHTVGAVARVELVIEPDSPFTGVLAPPPAGGATGLVRISLAAPVSGQKSITPGIGLKLFVDGRPSLDLVAMNHTVGQGRDFDLFSNTFTHDLTGEHDQLRPPQKLMSFFFTKVSEQPRRLTIDHLAAVHADGSPVAEPIVPERLVFVPHEQTRSIYAGAHGEDFRDPLLNIRRPRLRTLWRVDAVGAGEAGRDRPIGHVRMAGPFTCSLGGDRLFFRHHVADADRDTPSRRVWARLARAR